MKKIWPHKHFSVELWQLHVWTYIRINNIIKCTYYSSGHRPHKFHSAHTHNKYPENFSPKIHKYLMLGIYLQSLLKTGFRIIFVTAAQIFTVTFHGWCLSFRTDAVEVCFLSKYLSIERKWVQRRTLIAQCVWLEINEGGSQSGYFKWSR